MGWLWTSDPPQAAQVQKPLPPPPTEQSSAPNEPVDPEVQKFFDLFKQDPNPNPEHRPPPPSPSQPSPSSWLALKTPPSDDHNAPLGDALSEALLPTEMSCRQAFDLAWACNGLGGQFNSVYRYGNMRSCSEQWDDFWFCMRTRAYTGELKEDMVRTYYRNKAHRKYGEGKPNSEDFWESRKEKLPPGSAFHMPIAEANVGDDEWRKLEAERRAKIRKEMNYQS